MVTRDDARKARELLDRGAYREAAEAFLKMGEAASAARALVCAKDYGRAAECYELAMKPLDAARLYLQVRAWRKAAQLYASAGDKTRAALALEQLRKEQEAEPAGRLTGAAGEGGGVGKGRPGGAGEATWPAGELWDAIRAGDFASAAQIYTHLEASSGWKLVGEAEHPEALHGLGETLALARDYAVAGECFRRSGELLRAAQVMSLAGLNAEAADLYLRADQKVLAAQHLEKIRDWRSAARVYRDCNLLLDAARCHEKDDEPVKAAGLYLKARKADLALPLLQAVAPHHRHFAQCRLLAAKVLFQKNQRDLAVDLLAPLLDGAPGSDYQLETYYQVALLFEQSGETAKARETYDTIQRARFGYKDVEGRVKALAAPARSPQGVPPESAVPDVDLSPLRECTLFNRLSLEDLRHLAAMGRILEPAPGEILLEGGRPDEALYVVLEGGLSITPDPSDTGLAVGFLAPGDYVGLGSLVPCPPRPNALVAQAGTRLLLLAPDRLEPLVSSDPEVGLRLFRSIADHLAQTLAAQKLPR